MAGGEGGEEKSVSGSDGLEKGGRRVLSMTGQRRGTPRWEDNTVVDLAEAGKRRLQGMREIGR